MKGFEFDGNTSSSPEDKTGEFVVVFCCAYKVIKLFSIFEDYIGRQLTQISYDISLTLKKIMVIYCHLFENNSDDVADL